jgi:hypothetical protein
MAYPAAPAEPKRRPAVVTVAGWLLYLAAASQVVSAVVTVTQLGATRQAYTKVLAGTSLGAATDLSVATVAVQAAVNLVFAIGYVVVAILNGRGKNPARIVTWVIAGLATCLAGCRLASAAIALGGLGANGGNGAPSGQEIQKALDDSLPGWYQPLLTVGEIISLVAVVAAVVLLALPIANDFFRKTPTPGWEPPLPTLPPPTA